MTRTPPAAVAALALALAPAAARPNSLTLDDALYSQADCAAASAQALSLSWDLSSSSGDSVQILGSDTSGCGGDGDVTAVLVDGLSTSQTSYPVSGDAALTLDALLSAAGKSACSGSDYRVYLCVRLLDASGGTVTTLSAGVKLQLQRPPAPVDVAVAPGEQALHVSWSAGTATTDAPAASVTYQVLCSVGGTTVASGTTTGTSLGVGGLENGTTYDVRVVAYSEAGNASAASELAAGTPQPVSDFWETYQAQGGREQGGCATGGGGGALAGLAVLLAPGLRRVRRRRRGA